MVAERYHIVAERYHMVAERYHMVAERYHKNQLPQIYNDAKIR